MDGKTSTVSRFPSEKLVRLVSSAAVCGLTVSFLFGEMVNANPGVFQNWVKISQIAPNGYPAVAPVVAYVDVLKNGDWFSDSEYKDTNELPKVAAVDEILLAEASLPQVTEDTEQAQKKVHDLMNSVHEAASQIAEDKISTVSAAPLLSEDDTYDVTGKIIIEGDRPALGHFEVVAHQSINTDGSPVGAPTAQTILKLEESSYRITIRGTKEQYIFLKYFDGSKQTNAVKVYPLTANPIGPLASRNQQQDFFVSGLFSNPTPSEPAEKSVAIAGKIKAMFSEDFLPLADATVRVRGGSNTTITSTNGEFTLHVPEFSGEIMLEVVRKDFFPTIFSVSRKNLKENVLVELASREVIDRFATTLGIRQSRSNGVFIGKALTAKGAPMANVIANITNRAEGPFYFANEGHPVAKSALKSTSTDGRFIIFNVEPGVGFLDLQINGESVAPIIISPVDGGGTIFKKLRVIDGKVRGRVFNPIASGTVAGKKIQAITGARLRVEGSLEWSISDSFGAFELPQFRYIQDEPIAIEVTSDRFYTHRYQTRVSFNEIAVKKYNDLTLFAFPSNYINGLASSLDITLDPFSGLILGGASLGKSLRIDALSDHAAVSSAKDYYFDEHGGLRGGRAGTHPKYGTFVIFNVPKGRTLIQGNDQAGKSRFYSSIYASPSVVSVVLE